MNTEFKNLFDKIQYHKKHLVYLYNRHRWIRDTQDFDYWITKDSELNKLYKEIDKLCFIDPRDNTKDKP